MSDLKILEHHVENLSRCLDFIESRLTQRISVQDLAKVACMSLWHFQRVFHALVGEPAKSYVRRRKLTNAAGLLLGGNISLESLARCAGFSSQEAFARAFTAQFATTPGKFRTSGQIAKLPTARPRINREYVKAMFSKQSAPKVEVTKLEAFPLYGISGKFHSCFSERADSTTAVPALWKEFHKQLPSELCNKAKNYWGLISAPQDKSASLFTYQACVELTGNAVKGPAALQKCRHPGGLYAVFKQSNPPTNIVHSLNYVFCIWLEKSGYTLDDREEFELYAPQYATDIPEQSFHYGIPIRVRNS